MFYANLAGLAGLRDYFCYHNLGFAACYNMKKKLIDPVQFFHAAAAKWKNE